MYIVLRCKVYDLKGREIAFLKSHMCWFGPDCHSIKTNHGIAFEFDEKSAVVWRLENTSFHHTLSKSLFGEEFLTLNSDYTGIKDYPQVRVDDLVVFNHQGKITKQFKMADYLRKNPHGKPPSVDSWSFDPERKAWEMTHGNSFKEIWKFEKGIKKHTGYIFFSNYEKVLYFLNKSLTKVTRKITLGRPLHDIQQYNENQLIAYGNTLPPQHEGGIFLIDLKTGSLKSIYKFTRPEQFSRACSSLQVLPENKFFMVHSRCDENGATKTVVEFLDLNSGRNSFLALDTGYSFPAGYLADLSSYFEKSYSH